MRGSVKVLKRADFAQPTLDGLPDDWNTGHRMRVSGRDRVVYAALGWICATLAIGASLAAPSLYAFWSH